MKRAWIFLLAAVVAACGVDREKEGERLARTYCASCHVYPEPGLLDKRSWFDGVIPSMGPRMGMQFYRAEQYMYNTRDALVPKGLYPDQPIMKQEEWEMIVEYIVHHAPDSLARPAGQTPIPVSDKLFTVVKPESVRAATTAWVEVDTTHHQISIASGSPFQLEVFDQQLKRVSQQSTSRVLSGRHVDAKGTTALIMGQLTPNDVHGGQLQYWPVHDATRPQVLLDSMERPVQLRVADLNMDGRDDYLVCSFGNFTGSLAWYESGDDGKLVRHVLRQLPGAMTTTVRDFNGDGKPDVLALMAQGDEGVFLYTNKGNGKFEEKNLLRFSPVWGSTSLEAFDMNGDGHTDLIYTCGDNADYSKVLKPYHGVYVYLNDGQWNFSQAYFYPINGCFKAITRDYDQDGDLDIATIAYFPDYQQRPEESFVLLQNEGQLHFTPSTVSCFVEGRWLTMDAGDYDGDGDEDLVLGNMAVGPTNMKTRYRWTNTPPFFVLKNNTR